MEQWEPVSRDRNSPQSNAPPCKPSNAPCELRVIEWHHMDLRLFYPLALTSTWTVRVMLYPLDVLRTRLQLQKQSTVYRSTWDAFRSIAKHEGVGGLFRGFWVTVPKLGTSFIYSTVYEKLRATLQQDYGYKSAAFVSSIAGGAASFCSQPIFVPMDIISQHMMIYNYADKFISGTDRRIIEHLRQDGVKRGALGWRTIKAIYKCDGPSGFYRGFWASAAVYVPICLISWPVYYWTQDFLKAIHGDRNFLLLDQAISATVGGAAATVGTNPMEIFRARLQVHRTNYRDTLERMLRDEGLSLFTKGLAPRLINNSTFSCIVMVGYEVVKRMCVLPEYKDAVRW